MDNSSEEELYNVEEILDKRVKGDKVYYFIKWENYPGQDSWEPVENLNDMAMLAEFEQKLTEKNVIQAKNSKSSSIITESAEESKKLSIKEPKNVEKMKKNRVSIDEDNGECLMNDVSENLSKVMRAQIEIQRAKPIDRIVGVRFDENELLYAVSNGDDDTDYIFITSSTLRESNPKLIIDYLEKHVSIRKPNNPK